MPTAIIHVGTHKTGTTSLQRWAEANRAAIEQATGYRYYQGLFGPSHYELAMLCLRPDRGMPKRSVTPGWETPEFAERVRAHIDSQTGGDLLVSAEALCYMRHPDEVDALRDLLGGYELRFVVVLREPAEYLRSYRAQMALMGFEPSSDPNSFAYTADGTWLTDYDALVDLLDPVVVEYPKGSVIPAIFEALDFDTSTLPDWSDEWCNRTP